MEIDICYPMMYNNIYFISFDIEIHIEKEKTRNSVFCLVFHYSLEYNIHSCYLVYCEFIVVYHVYVTFFNALQFNT